MNEIIEKLRGECQAFILESQKKPSKAGNRRMRKATLEISRLGKEFRKLSVEADKA